ncbi:hypothetical protein BaRGS_00013241 [Batillaria attramentaria]|uniref:Uncharacterized protein n=1 Tax=Batillaria attramentaria TaxID=370345 RepID=A0ABD0L8D8_9CAEN
MTHSIFAVLHGYHCTAPTPAVKHYDPYFMGATYCTAPAPSVKHCDPYFMGATLRHAGTVDSAAATLAHNVMMSGTVWWVTSMSLSDISDISTVQTDSHPLTGTHVPVLTVVTPHWLISL